jgi:hypothetical protein
MMTLIFPFAGARGGLFHSGAALQPFFWAGAPLGLKKFIDWGVKKRSWDYKQARLIFSAGFILFAITLSGFSFYQKVIGTDSETLVWEMSESHYRKIENALIDLGAMPEEIVMVKNPPGYYVTNNRNSIVIPDGDIQTLTEVAKRYKAKYVVLEKDHSNGLNPLYLSPAKYQYQLKYVDKIDDTLVFITLQ